MAAKNTRNTLVLGLFVFVAMAAAGVMILVFRGSRFFVKTYQVYSLWDNIGGMLVNNPVLLGGNQIGRIRAITPPHAGDARAEGKVEVVLEIEETYPLYDFQPLRVISIGMIGDKYVEFGLRLNRATFERRLSDLERRKVLARLLALETDPESLPPDEKERRAAARSRVIALLAAAPSLDEARRTPVAADRELLGRTLDQLAAGGAPIEEVYAALGTEGLVRHDLKSRWQGLRRGADGRPVGTVPDPIPGAFPPSMTEVFDEVSPKISRVLDELNSTVTNLNQNYLGSSEFKDKVQGTLDKAAAAIEKFGATSEKAGRLIDRLQETDGTLERANRTLATAGESLAEVRDKVKTLGAKLDATLGAADEDLRALRPTLDQMAEITRKINAGEGTIGRLVNDREFSTKTADFLDSAKVAVDNINRFILFLTENPSALVWGKKEKKPATLGPVDEDWRARHE
ncbi:MAG: hypothetical protein HZA54_21085 [Planctomycetes bacterium]|nr:hypothetical protein [Planctomycetota bacterium]